MQLLPIEDDLDFGNALQLALAQADLPTVWVRRLVDGNANLENREFDCILLDLNLPDGEGFSLLDRIRRRGIATPVLVISAREALDDRLRALNGGADDYVIKPFMMPELIARVHVLVRRSAGHAAPRWQLGELEIDTVSQSVMRNGELIGLTGREYAILRELAAASGRVVRREQLCLRVWPDEAVPSAGALEFQIHALRRKLGTGAIRTIRGVGYMLSAQ